MTLSLDSWPTENITAVHPGVRVAAVKISSGIFVKLVLLLQEEDKEYNSVLVGGMSKSSA